MWPERSEELNCAWSILAPRGGSVTLRERPMLQIPDKFNRNHSAIRALGSQADTGLWLINYIGERIGAPNLTGIEVLDFGCGCRFADAIVNRNVPLKSYVGIDVYKEMIEFLAQNVNDERIEFFHLDAKNPGYNKDGTPMSVDTVLPIGNRQFDLVSMYSVITHQLPEDAAAIFTLLRKACRSTGHLFFSAAIEDGDFGYRETMPEAPTALSVYSWDLIKRLVEEARWRITSFERRAAKGLPNQDTFVCVPN
jgi:SAM-dependent methyltransferase